MFSLGHSGRPSTDADYFGFIWLGFEKYDTLSDFCQYSNKISQLLCWEFVPVKTGDCFWNENAGEHYCDRQKLNSILPPGIHRQCWLYFRLTVSNDNVKWWTYRELSAESVATLIFTELYMGVERRSTVQALRKERHNGPHPVRLKHCTHPGEIQVAARQSAPGSSQHLGAGETQEAANPWDTRTIHPVRQGRGEALCPQKDQKQHPTKAQEWEMSVDLARKLQFPPSYSNIPEAWRGHLVRAGKEDNPDWTDCPVGGRVWGGTWPGPRVQEQGVAGLAIPSRGWMQRIPSTVSVEDAHSVGNSRKEEEDISSQAGEVSRMSLLLAVEYKGGDELEIRSWSWPPLLTHQLEGVRVKDRNTRWRLGTVWWHQLQAKGYSHSKSDQRWGFSRCT